MKRKQKQNNKAQAKKLFIFFLLLISSGAVFYYFYNAKKREKVSFANQKFQVRGVDLSHHNPIIEWDKHQGHNVNFAYLKATGGITHTDRNYEYNYEVVRKNGIKAGSYHFYLFGASGKEQATHFIKRAKCNSGDLIPAIDVEHSPDNPYSKDTAYINLVIGELKILENELYEYYGFRPLIYTNRDCYKLYVKDNFPDNLIWMCDLQNEPSDVGNWIIWQFSHKGRVGQLDEDIDLNYFRHPYNQLDKILIP